MYKIVILNATNNEYESNREEVFIEGDYFYNMEDKFIIELGDKMVFICEWENILYICDVEASKNP